MILTAVLGFLPIVVVVILYSIILHHALRKVMQLKQAARNHHGAVSGNLRIHVGTGTTAMPSHISGSRSSDNGGEMSRKTSVVVGNNGAGVALSDTEEPLQPPPSQTRRRGIFNFLSR